MSGRVWRRPAAAAACAALLALAAPGHALGAALLVTDGDGGVLETLDLGRDGRWCLLWNHSVRGFEVEDCFRVAGGGMLLETSHQPDYAAGLGESPGATVRPDGAGGYRLEGLDRAVPQAGLALRRAGPAVDQRIRIGDVERPLPDLPRGTRLFIRPAPGDSPAATGATRAAGG